jgi:hypothetical protein
MNDARKRSEIVNDTLTHPFTIVVSSDNTSYLAWQTMLFCYSALSRLGQHPVVIVHSGSTPLRKEFMSLRRLGMTVVEAPLFINHRLGTYLPRNEIGSLLIATALDELKGQSLLFCEPDMLFKEPLWYTTNIAAEYYNYLNYNEGRVRRVCTQLGIVERTEDLNNTLKVGVPYFLPQGCASQLAPRWLAVVDAFDELDWIDIMYAFGIALLLEGVDVDVTRQMTDNKRSLDPMCGKVLHYCYGDTLWNKRTFRNGRTPFHTAGCELPRIPPGTVLEEIVSQVAEARSFYSGTAE